MQVLRCSTDSEPIVTATSDNKTFLQCHAGTRIREPAYDTVVRVLYSTRTYCTGMPVQYEPMLHTDGNTIAYRYGCIGAPAVIWHMCHMSCWSVCWYSVRVHCIPVHVHYTVVLLWQYYTVYSAVRPLRRSADRHQRLPYSNTTCITGTLPYCMATCSTSSMYQVSSTYVWYSIQGTYHATQQYDRYRSLLLVCMVMA